MRQILIGATSRQPLEILRAHLASLVRLRLAHASLALCFIDDNDSADSSALLRDFVGDRGQVLPAEGPRPTYDCSGETHGWSHALMARVARAKDRLLDAARAADVDYVLLVDSDLVLHPRTLEYLLAAQKDIVSEVYWTRWRPGDPELPQVWVTDQYTLYRSRRGETLTAPEMAARQQAFLDELRVSGVYPVGGLGGCTLISRRALQAGVSFADVPNVSLWGEDRHFCIRAAALGLGLFVDTHVPALHLYRDADLARLPGFLAAGEGPARQRITVSMIVRNEADRHLRRVLEHAATYADRFVIIDDASTDDTVRVCREAVGDVPLTLLRLEAPMFAGNEALARQRQWAATVATDPDWILVLDADERLEDRATVELPRLVQQDGVDVFVFRLFDLWDEDHYREDALWQAHTVYMPALVRYRPDVDATWGDKAVHARRLPTSFVQRRGRRSDLRIQHLGWSRAADRAAKYAHYQALDPDGRHGWPEQYASILDPEPRLVRWDSPPEPGPRVDDERLASRFVRVGDARMHEVVFPLPAVWWSRPYEYAFAAALAAPEHTVLDAGAGVCHPFKLELARRCREVHVIDLDRRILVPAAIVRDVAAECGEEAAARIPSGLVERVHAQCGSIADLPYPARIFDRVFCLSVLEHLDAARARAALMEMRRVLRPGGLLVLTVDWPDVDLSWLVDATRAVGLGFAGAVSLDVPPDGLESGGVRCFRGVLRVQR